MGKRAFGSFADWVQHAGRLTASGGAGRMGRIVLTPGMIACEGILDGGFRAFVDENGGDEALETSVIDGETVVAKRGRIVEFTRKSQTRLMKALSGWVPRDKLLVVALTYPAEFPGTEEAKADFERFRRLLRNEHPEWAGMWKLEYQTRGAVHFHLVLDAPGVGSSKSALISMREWIARKWMKARRSEVPARTQCDRARHQDRARFYLAKEIGKMVQTSNDWRASADLSIQYHGRVWGWINKRAINFHADEWFVPIPVGMLFRQKVQQIVKADWIKRGLLKEERPGFLVFKKTSEFDFDRLPSWQLLTDPETEFMRLVDEVKAETGFDLFVHGKKCAEPDFSLDDITGDD